jgi:YD repeat-containing protein
VTDSTQTGSVVTTVRRDGAGRVSKRTDQIDGKTFVSTFDYDANDNLVEIGYPSGRHVRYSYDGGGRLARVYNLETGQVYASNFTYHGSGAVAGFTAGNGVVTTLEFEPRRDRLKSINVAVTGNPLHLVYGYDLAGNVTTLDEGPIGSVTARTFTYDRLERLKTATAIPNTKYPDTSFEYDAHGNRTGAGFDYYDDHFRLETFAGSAQFSYDHNGNLTNGPVLGGAGTFTYTYRADNLMSRAVTSSGTTDYTYDAGALRIKRTDGSTSAYFLKAPDSRLVTEWTPTSATEATAHDYIYAGSQLLGVATTTVPAN